MGRTALVFLVAAVVAVQGAVTFAEDRVLSYDISGTVEGHARAGYWRNSPVILSEELRGTWFLQSFSEARLLHQLSREDGAVGMVADHSIVLQIAGVPEIKPGEGGQRAKGSAVVLTDMELYQLAFHWKPGASEVLEVVAGRHFDVRRRRQEQEPDTLALLFPVVDVLHPREVEPQRSPGMDGASLVISSPDGMVRGQLAVALQDALRDSQVHEGFRIGAALLVGRGGVTVAWQERRMLRPGAFLQFGDGALRVLVEGAVEAYDPRGQEVVFQPIGGVRLEMGTGSRAPSGDASAPSNGLPGWHGALEYHYNGLAGTYPEPHALVFSRDNRVTRDGAGGFLLPGAHYLHGALRWRTPLQWETDHGITVNLDDGSLRVYHHAGLTVAPPVNLHARVWWHAGSVAAEFGRTPVSALATFSAVFSF